MSDNDWEWEFECAPTEKRLYVGLRKGIYSMRIPMSPRWLDIDIIIPLRYRIRYLWGIRALVDESQWTTRDGTQ